MQNNLFEGSEGQVKQRDFEERRKGWDEFIKKYSLCFDMSNRNLFEQNICKKYFSRC